MWNNLKEKDIEFGIICIFLLCYFMMLFDFPNVLTIFISSMICLMLMIRQKKFRFNIGTFFLVLTISSYFLILYKTRAFTMSLPYVGIVMYVLGNYLSCEVKNKNDYERRYGILLIVLVIGHTIHGILNSYMFLAGYIEDSVRHWLDFWMRVFLPGTQQIVYFFPALAFVFPAMIDFKKNKILYSFIIISAILFLYISLASQTRTAILVFGIVFVVQMVVYLWIERRKIITFLKTKKIKKIIAIGILAVIIAFVCMKDLPLIRDFMSIMGRDGGILNNVRFQMHRLALEQLFLYPMGGRHMELLGRNFAHNSWLDIANAAGLIPFFAFAAYTVFIVYELIRWLIKKEISTKRKIMMIGLFVSFFLYNTVERAFEGSMHFMTPWFFMNGLIHGELKNS